MTDATKKRRPKGTGTVRWRERLQRWEASQVVGYDYRGKRVTVSATAKSEAQALKKLAEKVEREKGIRDDKRYTVQQAVEDFLKFGLGAQSEQTRKHLGDLAKVHIVPEIGQRTLASLTADDVDRWLRALSKQTTQTGKPRLSTRTLRDVLSLLARIIHRAQARERVHRNVAELCTAPRGGAGRPARSLTVEQARAVLDRVEQVRDPMWGYIAVSIMMGARTEELRALRWGDVQLAAEPPHVHLWRSVREGGDTKTKRSRRTLELPERCIAALRYELENARWAGPDDLVFVARDRGGSNRGRFRSAGNVRRSFRRAIQDVPEIDNPSDWAPRDLRHTFVSVMSAEGMSLESIADVLGHEGTAVTERVYRHQLRPVLVNHTRLASEAFASKTDPIDGTVDGTGL